MTSLTVVCALVTAGALVQTLRLTVCMRVISHACRELAVPLATARLIVGAMARRGEVGPDRIAALDAELHRASMTVADLAATRMGDHRDDPAVALEVAELVAEQRARWSAVAHAFGREVHCDEGPGGVAVRGDRVQLTRALTYLVANAFEHGAGPVAISARCAGPTVRLAVADDGAGLPVCLDELVGRSESGRCGGLALVAQIARHHGGRLARMPSGHGACIALELPVANEALA